MVVPTLRAANPIGGEIPVHAPLKRAVLDEPINLHWVLGHGCPGWAARDTVEDNPRLSLQFFSRDGSVVHQVYLARESRRDAH